jgi:hypothetical protein
MEKRIKMVVPGHMEYIYDETGKYVDCTFIEDENGSAEFKDENNEHIELSEEMLEKVFNN